LLQIGNGHVEIAAFEIDHRRGIVLVGGDREGRAALGLEAGITRAGPDDLPQPQEAIETFGSGELPRGHRHLVQHRLEETHVEIEPHRLLPHRAVAASQIGGLAHCDPHEATRAVDGFGQVPFGREATGDRRGERAAGAVRRLALDPRIAPFDHRRIIGIGRVQPVGDLRRIAMPALDQHGAAMRRDQRRGIAAQCFELGEVGRDDCRAAHQPLERGDRRIVRQRRAAARDHDGVEHHGHGELGELVGERQRRARRTDHPDLDRIDADIAHHCVHLRDHHVGGHRVHGADAERVLRGDRSDRGHRVAAEHRDGLDIGLDASAATRIGTGNDQDTRRHTIPPPSP
jgi:hypothetical protein